MRKLAIGISILILVLSLTNIVFAVPVESLNAYIASGDYVYDGTAHEPETFVYYGGNRLQVGQDYTVQYENNTMPTSEAKVSITGVGEYTGTKEIGIFTIRKRSVVIEAYNKVAYYSEEIPELNYIYREKSSPVPGIEPIISGDLVTDGTNLSPSGVYRIYSATNFKIVNTNIYNQITSFNYNQTLIDDMNVSNFIPGKLYILGVAGDSGKYFDKVILDTTSPVGIIDSGVIQADETLTIRLVDVTDNILPGINGSGIASTKWNVQYKNEGSYTSLVTNVVHSATDSSLPDNFAHNVSSGDKVVLTRALSGTYKIEVDIYDAVGNSNKITKEVYIGSVSSQLMAREPSFYNYSNNKAYMLGASRLNKDLYASDVSKIVFTNTAIPSGTYEDIWDVSSLQNNSVKSWIVRDSTDNTKFIQYIGAETEVNGKINASSCENLFNYYTSLKSIEFNNVGLNTLDVTSMAYMFANTTLLNSIDLTKYDTRNVTNMEGMFNNSTSISTLTFSNNNTLEVTNMKKMFDGCSNLTTITVDSYFDTLNVENMSYMFNNCTKLGNGNVINGNNFRTTKVTDTSYMFGNCSAITTIDLTKFNTTDVTTMKGMFSGCSNLTNVSTGNLETQNVEDMSEMFKDCSKLQNIPLGSFDTANVKNMSSMFEGTKLSTINFADSSLSGFNTSNVTDMSSMFKNCTSITNANVDGLEFNSVQNIANMFEKCTSLVHLNLNSLNTTNVTLMSEMFKDDSNLQTMLLGTNVKKLIGADMFSGTSSLTAVISLSTTPVQVGQLINFGSNTVLYVPNEDVESAYESSTSHVTVFGNVNNIEEILALVGDSTISIQISNEDYDDAGYTVAGIGETNASNYTQYGFSVSETLDSDVHTNTVGRYYKTYTAKFNSDTLMSVTRTIDVQKKSISDLTIDVQALPSYVYDGKEKRPTVTVTDTSTNAPKPVLTLGTDYDVQYSSNKDVGEATVQIIGQNGYYGTETRYFTITKRDLNITIGPITSYTKRLLDDDPVFNYTYSNNVLQEIPVVPNAEVPSFQGAIGREAGEDVGTYRLNQGTLTVNSSETFNINNYNVIFSDNNATLEINQLAPTPEGFSMSISQSEYEYDGTEHKPSITLTYRGTLLTQGVDFDPSYRNNKNAGTAIAVAVFKGNYTGEMVKTFNINQRPITIVPNSNQSKIYDENDPVLTYYTTYGSTTETGLLNGEVPNYSGALTRSQGTLPGLYDILNGSLTFGTSATFIQENYKIGFMSGVPFEIKPKSLPDNLSVSLVPNSFDYDGFEKKPGTIVSFGNRTLVRDTDYYVTYENNVNVGTETVKPTAIIHGKGGFTGDKSVEFTIVPASITIVERIDGETDLGQTLAVITENLNPEGATLTYKWYVVNSNSVTGGTQIAGATTSRLLLTDDYIGKYIYSVVTASLPSNYRDTEWRGVVGPIRETNPPTIPTITAKLENSTGAEYTSGTWTNKNVWLNVKSNDDSNIAYYEYSVVSDSAGFTRMPDVGGDGSSTLLVETNKNKIRYYFRGVDNSGNKSEVASIVIAIDKDAPVITELIQSPNTWTNGSVSVIGSARDDLSGVTGYLFGETDTGVYTVIPNTINTTQEVTYDTNVENYVFVVVDSAGNKATRQFSVNKIDESLPTLVVNEKVTANDNVVVFDIKAKDPDIDLNGDGIPDGNGSGIASISVNNVTITTEINAQSEEVALHSVYDGGTYSIKATDYSNNQVEEIRHVYSVTYVGNRGNGTMSKQVKYENTSVTIKQNSFTSANHTFVNWNTKPDGTGTTYNPGDTYSGEESITLYAQWNEVPSLLRRVTLERYSYSFTGKAIKPQEYVYNNSNKQIVRDIDYKVSYRNNIDAGVATVVITGINKYDGQTIETEFQILKTDTSASNDLLRVELEDTLFVYDGYAKTPKETVYYGNDIIRRGPDYKVRYENNVNAGTATITITPEPHIDAKETTLTFTISKANRKVYAYDVFTTIGETLALDYSYNGDAGPIELKSSDENIVTTSVNGNVYKVTAQNTGVAKLTFSVGETNNYNSGTKVVNISVYDEETPPPVPYPPVDPEPEVGQIVTNEKPEGIILINDGEEYTATPRTLLYIDAQNADYMFISESPTKPDVDNIGWQDYSMRLPYEFDSEVGFKTIYAYFKDSKGNISNVAYDTIKLVDTSSSDVILNGYGYDEIAHDSIILDKTEINKTPPTISYVAFRNAGLDIDVTFKQQDVMINGTRSGVDPTTIKYGYMNLDDGSTHYTWQDSKTLKNLRFATNYAFVTRAYDKAGNGYTISNPLKFVTADRYGTIIKLTNTNTQFDGTIHEIKKATFDLVDSRPITGTVTYTYYIDKNCTIETTPEKNGSLHVGSAPSEPGTYYVIVRLRDDPNYFDIDSNIGELRIGWFIGVDDDNMFAYIEETIYGSEEYILHVTGTGKMRDLDDIKAHNTVEEHAYWKDYRNVITELDIGTGNDDDIRNIGAGVFSGLTKIEEIVIPDSVTAIGDGAFEGDRNVTEKVIIPGGITTIGKNPFVGVNTEEFEIKYGNNYYDTIDGVLVDKKHETIISYPCGNHATEYRIPAGIITIGDDSFRDADILEHVIIPDGVQDIYSKAFYDCDELKTVEIEDLLLPDNGRKDLTIVGNDAFNNISDNSIIYTFSKDIAEVFEDGADYNSTRTKVYYPPTIVKQPEDMNGAAGRTVKFIVKAEKGYPEDTFYKWFVIPNGQTTPGEEAYGEETYDAENDLDYFTTGILDEDDNQNKYYVRVYNDDYYFNKVHPEDNTKVGYVNSRQALLTMLNNSNYEVERGTYNTYFFERLDDAFDFSTSGDIIRVINNVPDEVDATFDGEKKVILSLNSHTINTTGIITISSESTMDIIGSGSINRSNGGYVIDNNGKLNLNGSFTIENSTGSGIKSNTGSYLTLDSATITAKTEGINATNAHVNITSDDVAVNTISNGSTHAISLHGDTRFVMEEGSIRAECTSTNGVVEDVAGIFVNEGINGRNEINGGTITVVCGSSTTPNTNIGSGITNAGSSDIILTGTIIDASKARAGIEMTQTNKYGDVIVKSGSITGGKFGVLNNGDISKIVMGTKDGNVTNAQPTITGETIPIFNTNANATFEFYDGTLLSGTELVIYQCTNNPSLTISSGATGVHTENGRVDVIPEDGYSVFLDEQGRFHRGTLNRDKSPEIMPLTDKYVRVDERTTLEVVIINPGHPTTYNFEWEVSNDNGNTWTRVTVGNGANTDKFTIPPMTPNMDGYQYRCKITNGDAVLYTNSLTIHLIEENAFKEQRPIVRIIYTNGRKVQYDTNNAKYVDMQVIIKAYEPLETVKFDYGTNSIENLLDVTNIIKNDTNNFSMEYTTKPPKDSNGIDVPQIISQNEPKIAEYTYEWNMKAYKNDAITVKAIDSAGRDAFETQTIDIVYDLRVDKTLSKLSDSNSDLTITFFANRPVRPTGSDGVADAFSKLKNVDGDNYSFKYTYIPGESIPKITFYFEDEFGNKASCVVEAITRVKYKDIKFNANGTSIDDLSIKDAYGVAQGLETETEVNSNLDVQSRYGVNRSQIDMFMGRARDLGAAEMLMKADSSRSYDGTMAKDQAQTQPKEEVYDYVGNTDNNYVSTVAGEGSNLNKENNAYVDKIKNSDLTLYKGNNLEGFAIDDANPYMIIDSSGHATNTDDKINEATFRAVIVNN